MRQYRRSLFVALAVAALVTAIWIFTYLLNPPQPSLDQRVQDVASQLKCPICEGESVASSNSDLAQQMRDIIRQQLSQGRSEQQVIQYFADRYGQQIVLEPGWRGFSLLAWLAPIALLIGGAALLYVVLREWRAVAPATLAAESAGERDGADEGELEPLRTQLEQELAAEDPLFEHYRTEAR